MGCPFAQEFESVDPHSKDARRASAHLPSDGEEVAGLIVYGLVSSGTGGAVEFATTAGYGHDAGHRALSIQRKGGKTAKVAVPAPAVEALNLYLGTTGADLVPGQGPGASLPLFTKPARISCLRRLTV